MFFVVGLGNPGKKFENTRHNLGFNVLNYFALENKFPEFKIDKKSNSLISDQFFGKQKVFLIKPQTFMNLSGKSVKFLLNYYNKKSFFSFLIEKIKKKKYPLDNLIVIHDDLDISLGKFKIIQKGGAAGHNGVKSIIQELNTNNFTRIKIGIQPEEKKELDISSFVLEHFNKKEEEIIDNLIKKINKELKTTLLP